MIEHNFYKFKLIFPIVR